MRPHRHIRLKTKSKAEAKQALVLEQSRLKPDMAPVVPLMDGRKVSLGYRMSPDMRNSHSIRIHFTPMGGGCSTDSALNTRQKQAKYSTQPLNCGRSPRMEHETGEVKVRIGTTPSRLITVTDKETGEVKRIKTRPKPRWGSIGVLDKPKDGGIGW